jgi:hypothetical protein
MYVRDTLTLPAKGRCPSAHLFKQLKQPVSGDAVGLVRTESITRFRVA